MAQRRREVMHRGLGLLFASAGAFLGGCAVNTYVARAERAYADGRYLEVAESLERHEGDVQELPHDRQARYGVFRGLALLRLGDYEGAERWLSWAAQVERQMPTLSPDQRRLLDGGLAEVQRFVTPVP
jgi:hypothetical protein